MQRRGLEYLALFGVAAAGLLLRLANLFAVFPGGGRVIFPGQDSYYHMRRILLIMEDWPSVPLFDSFMNFPSGAIIIWPPLFDFSIASLCLLCGFGAQDVRGVETLASFLVPLIGAGTILLLYYIAKGLFGRPEALLAAGLLAVSPAHAWYSRLGFVDHHAAATLLQLAMFLFFLKACRSERGRRTIWIAAGALAIAAGLLCWNGFLLYAAIVGGCLLLLSLAGEREAAPRIAGILSWGYLSAALLLLPFAFSTVARTGARFSSVTLSFLHVGLLLLIGLVGGAIHFSHSRYFRSWPRWLRISVPALLLLVAIVFLVSQAPALDEGLGWLLRSDPFISVVNESLPMINIYKEAGTGSYRFSLPMTMTLFHLLFPVAWIAFVVRQWRRRSLDSARLLFAMWAAALFFIACGQRRFMEVLAPALALLIGWSVVRLYRMRARGWMAVSLLLLVLISYGPWLAGWASGRNRGEAEYDATLHETLKQFEPEASAGGVMNPWQLGHKILYLTGLPVVSNNFGSHIGEDSYRDWSAFFTEGDEANAAGILEHRQIRYVMVDYDMESFKAALYARGLDEESHFSWRPQPDGRLLMVARAPFLRSMFYRLTVLKGAGATLPDEDGKPVTIPALQRFSLVHESPGDGKGHIKVYEFK